jgi:carbonic anhydrase
MEDSLNKLIDGYQNFRKKYAQGDQSLMNQLAVKGQNPQTMVIACSDSRVDPALILQCDPGDLFIVRNVANIVPPCEKDASHHGVSAALEFGICYLNVKHLVILGHSQCGGICALLDKKNLPQNDFISHWVDVLKIPEKPTNADDLARQALLQSANNCKTFPWLAERLQTAQLQMHLWFFDIEQARLETYSPEHESFEAIV